MQVLLVHGAWHGAWCWSSFLPVLEARGLSPHTLTLPGHRGNEANPFLVTMQSYAEAICARARVIVKESGEPVAVVAHSMGGLAVAAAGELEPALFSRIIFVTAWLPDPDARVYELLQLAPNPQIEQALEPSPLQGLLDIDRDEAAGVFYNRCSPEQAAEAVAQLCPQPIRPGLARVPWTEERLGAIPKDYIECVDDHAIPIAGQRRLQELMRFERVLTLEESDHSPFLSVPEELADAVASLLEVPA